MNEYAQFLKYQVKTCWSPIHLAGVLFALVFPIVFTPPGLPGPSAFPTEAYVLDTTQVFLPLLGVVAMAGLVSSEYEARTAETLFASPFSRARLLLMRFGLALIYTSSLFALVLGAYAMRGDISAVEARVALASALVPATYLGSLGLLTGLVTHSTAAALLLPAGYWLLEVFTKGQYTRNFCLFSCVSSELNWVSARGSALATALILLVGAVAGFEARRG